MCVFFLQHSEHTEKLQPEFVLYHKHSPRSLNILEKNLSLLVVSHGFTILINDFTLLDFRLFFQDSIMSLVLKHLGQLLIISLAKFLELLG